MSLTAKARHLVETYGLLPDPQDRFQYLIEQSALMPPLPGELRIARHRVDGCMSAVWVVAERDGAKVHYRSDGDSPVVKALAWILADFYSGADASEIAATPPSFLERLGLQKALTENRRRGLQALITRYQNLAQAAVDPP
jgi:cysteine desulfuration protein SufE